MNLLLAAAAVDVTPPPGHPMGGYAARAGVSDGTADPLLATLIWLSTPDDDGVLWLSLDAPAVDTTLVADLAGAAASVAGIDPARVLVCASHTHSGPAGWSGCVHAAVPAEREPELARSLVSAVAATSLVRTPAEASWHTVDVPGVGTNRHRLDGPHDQSAGILALRSPAGRLEALLFDFACHPTVLGPENVSWSADWPGAARVAIASAVGDHPIVVGFLQGAAGDVSPRFTRQGRDHAEVLRLGGLFADPVSRSLTEAAVPLQLGVPRLSRTTVRLPVRVFPPAETVAVTVAQADAAVSSSGSGPTARIAMSRVEGARGLAAMTAADLPPFFDLPVTVVTLGDLAWLHLPVEPFASLGTDIAARSPFPSTRVVGYTDGYFGYLVDHRAAGSTIYESLITYFDPPATSHLVDATVDLLHAHRGAQPVGVVHPGVLVQRAEEGETGPWPDDHGQALGDLGPVPEIPEP